MKANYKLINALRSTANIIEKGEDYHWHNANSCNCGLLTKELLKEEEDLFTLQKFTTSIAGYWSDADLHTRCPVTGLPTYSIISKLLSYGLNQEDLKTIELINMRDKLDYTHVDTKEHRQVVSNWMRAKAEELETQLNPVANKTKQTQSV